MGTNENTTPDPIHRTPYNTTTSLLSHIIPLVLFACQSLHMRYALRPWWSLSKFGHVLLRVFFPESIIWFVGREEWERRWVVGEIERRLEEKGQLGGEWDEGSALQRVMSIQGGRVFFRFRDDQEQERYAVRKEMRNLDDELPAMPVAPESRGPSRQDTPGSRGPSTQGQRQGYSPRHPGLSPYLSSPEAVSPQSGARVTPPYPVSEYNLHLDDSTPPIPPIPSQFPQNFRRPSNQTTTPALASQRPSLHRNRTSETQLTQVLLNNTNALPQRPGIIWSVQPPTHLRRLLATDISLYIDILDRLPPGSPTFLNIINFHLALPPDLPTVLLISQLIWAITALALRSHAHSLEGETSVSLLEMYAVYALISFLIERLFIVGCRRPAWGGFGSGGYVIVEMNKADYTHDIQDLPPKHGSSRKAGPKYFWVPLVLMGLAYPAVLITYAAGIYKKSGKSMSGAPHIPAVMGVVTGIYVLAVLGFLGVQALERQGREPVGNWSRWIPKGKWVLWGLVGVGRVVVGIWGIWQIVEARQVGGWEGWWGWPHISG